MLSSIRGFASRHRRKFIVASIIVGGTIVAFKYAQKKLRDSQENEAKDFIERARRKQHFESTERTCNQVIVGMSTELSNAIIKEINTEEILTKLRSNPENKLELWDEMKILTFTRLTTFIYATIMLIITLRIQLNVLGGYLYLDTMTNAEKITDDIKQAYLSLVHYFISGGGLRNLVRLIRMKVRDILKSVSLASSLNIADMEQIFYSIQMAINSDPMDPNCKVANYVIPQELPQFGGPIHEKMYKETLEFFQSEEVIRLLSNSVSCGFSISVDSIDDTITKTLNASKKEESTIITNGESPSTSTNSTEMQYQGTAAVILNSSTRKMPLAKLIPIINGVTAKGFDTSIRPPNLATSLTTFFLVSQNTKLLGAKVYEKFSSRRQYCFRTIRHQLEFYS